MIIPILLYHSIGNQVSSSSRFFTWSTTPSNFTLQMSYLHENNYTPITVSKFVESINDKAAKLPQNPVLITFDDGFADFYAHAFPVLQDYSFVSTMYIIPTLVGETSRWLCRIGEDKRPIMSWEQIREIEANGVECGAHSCTHPQLDMLSPKKAHNEIIQSKSELENELGHAVSTFAYPYGYFNQRVRNTVVQAGYTSACAVKHAMSGLNDDLFALSRIIIRRETTLEQFAEMLKGLNLPITPVKEKFKTKVWRLIRRTKMLYQQRCIDDF